MAHGQPYGIFRKTKSRSRLSVSPPYCHRHGLKLDLMVRRLLKGSRRLGSLQATPETSDSRRYGGSTRRGRVATAPWCAPRARSNGVARCAAVCLTHANNVQEAALLESSARRSTPEETQDDSLDDEALARRMADVGGPMPTW